MALNRAPSGGHSPNNRERSGDAHRLVLIAALSSSSGRERLANNEPTAAEAAALAHFGLTSPTIEAIEESLS